MKKIFLSISLSLAATVGILTSCSRDFTETKFYQDEQAGSLTTVEQMQSFVNGTYTKMRSANYLGSAYRGYAQIHTDETYCTQYSGRNVQFATYTLNSQVTNVRDTWYSIYQTVANANVVINAPENLTWGGSADPVAIAKQVKYLKGQAYAIRALAFFDLLRLYGQQYSSGSLGVVLPTTYDPNSMMARSSVAETQAQIEKDFLSALENVGTTGTTAKNYLNKYSIEALMSRYFLYTGDFAKAAQYAGDVITSGKYSVIPASDLATSFAKEAPANSVFEISVGLNGSLGTTSYDYLMNYNGYANIAVIPSVYTSFDNNDVRKTLVNPRAGEYYLDGKFSNLIGSSNIKVVRYEEVLLNAAEAELKAGSAAKALAYINAIRTNRGLAAATSVTIDDVKKERLLELMGEGFRYWDLLRWNSTIPYYTNLGVRDASKDKTVGDKMLAFPIPLTETTTPGTKVVSNPGYDN